MKYRYFLVADDLVYRYDHNGDEEYYNTRLMLGWRKSEEPWTLQKRIQSGYGCEVMENTAEYDWIRSLL